ncbi:Lsr2 family protein [Streptacidiphilus sp. ASG 303]|uniref:histone-like nucleoid-structuring protein Lsr2 n=1 Tax=Streptacidiphilus sp. ASG 303 TaxID=2896847 RepID=UPI001E2A0AB0|nr:Lsr2 family protein [Streptacidiphilus sp. ASG 303]MCD0482495.1 Lsr2 family protein [Streptacidiphilus sp. ASG 303]
MAQKVQVLLVDDLDGGEADETVMFALDGVAYEIDLKSENADRLREVLAPFVEKGRKQSGRVGGSRAGRARPAAAGPRPASSSQETAKIRSWAKEQGMPVNDRGRVPSNVRKAYEDAHA